MELVVRHRVSLAVVLVAVAATASFLTYGLPRTPTPDERSVDFARVHYYSPALVLRTFAAHGIHFRYHYSVGGDLQVFSTSRTSDELSVDVGARKGRASWGPKYAYDRTLGNLDVRYGGSNPNTLAAVEAAVSGLH
jgi:hypothetical protein